MRPLATLPNVDTPLIEVFFTLNSAKITLDSFLSQSVFSQSLKTVHNSAHRLLSSLTEALDLANSQDGFNRPYPGWKLAQILSSFKRFEAVVAAELQSAALYLVSPKGGFDTNCLTDSGEALFPADLRFKVPGALPDVKAGAKCLGFDLPTAAGFHFHRANEAVLRAYFDAVAGQQNRPRSRNMGEYIKKMNKLAVGDARVIQNLQSLKDLHRNPLMHPDHIIQSIDEALALYAAIRAAMGYMLETIPNPALTAANLRSSQSDPS